MNFIFLNLLYGACRLLVFIVDVLCVFHAFYDNIERLVDPNFEG